MEWVISCNLKYYDVRGAFAKLNRLDWKQSNKNMAVNDIVYIYVGAPYSAIQYKCLITKVNLAKTTIDDHEFIINGENYENYGNHMELQLLAVYADDLITKEKMTELGVKGCIQGPRSVIPELKAFIDAIEV